MSVAAITDHFVSMAALFVRTRMGHPRLSQISRSSPNDASGLILKKFVFTPFELKNDQRSLRKGTSSPVVVFISFRCCAYKFAFASTTDRRTLADALVDADVFIGVAKAKLLSAELLNLMAPKPVIFALSNPEPEIRPDLALDVRDDLIIATGRSDFPNQVNNVLCFPYIFRGALDVRATCINQAMQIAAVEAIRQLVHEPVPQSVKDNYPGVFNWEFGANYILPKPIDPRLRERVPAAVAKAAIASGVNRIK